MDSFQLKFKKYGLSYSNGEIFKTGFRGKHLGSLSGARAEVVTRKLSLTLTPIPRTSLVITFPSGEVYSKTVRDGIYNRNIRKLTKFVAGFNVAANA